MSSKYEQTIIDTTKNRQPIPLILSQKKAVQKTAESTDNLVGGKIAEKIPKITLTCENQKKFVQSTEVSKEIYIPPKKQQQVIDEFQLL